MPGRGAAAHSRCGHARRADPRQGGARRLAGAPGPKSVAVRQRGRVGAADHGPAGGHAQRGHAGTVTHAPHRQGRRAADPHRRGPRDAPDGRAVRDRRDHRRSPAPRPPARGRGLPLFVRHAGRGGADGRRRSALPGGLRAGHRRHWPRGRRARGDRRARHLDQAVGAAPALQPCAERPRAGRAVPAPAGAGRARARARHRPEHRRRGGRAAGAVAGPAGAAVPRACAGRLARHRLRHSGVPEALPGGDRLAGRPGAPQRPPADGAAGEGRLLGQRDQARAGGWAERLPRLHPQGAQRRELPGLCTPVAGGAGCGVPAVRHPQRAQRGRHRADGRAGRLAAGAIRVPVPARHGRAAVRADRAWRARCAAPVPHLRPGGHARDAAGLPGAAAAGERGEYVVRQPYRRCGGAHRRIDRRPGGADGARTAPGRAAPAHRAAGGAVRRGAAQFDGDGSGG